MNNPNDIGKRIKQLRDDRPMRLFAELLGISFAAYQNYEYGKRIPPGPVLSRLSEISGKSVDWILSGADRVHEPQAEYLDTETKMLIELFRGMNKEQKREALHFFEGQKLRSEREKKLKEGA